MRVVVDSIPPDGIAFAEEHGREWLTNIPEFSRGGETYIQEPIRLSGRVSQEGRNLRLKGEFSTRIHTLCARCGDEVDWPLQGIFDLVLMPGLDKSLEEEDLDEMSPEEMDHLCYQGPVVELDDYFREELALEIPIQVLCREDCRGLCPQCGANLNRETCSCPKTDGDPRLSILRNLKVKS